MKVLAVYPGRFQPFHKGHAQVYQWLNNKFGDAVIGTSDKVEAPKSPFNFKEKKKMMTLAGVPSSKIKQVTNPYIAREILEGYDPKTTVLVFAVSQKDMEEDPRFSFKPTKSGKPGYLQPYKGNEKKLKPFGDVQSPKGYVVVTPTFTFDVLGQPATSASELRKQFVSLDNKTQKEFIKDLFGKYDESVHKLMKDKLPKPKTIKQLKEEITRKQLAPMLDSFVSFASDKLGLKSMPTVRYKTDDDDYNSFAAYNPSSNELSVHTMNRHPMDIFRSVAHELVHHKQNEDGRLGKDIEKEGATGSDIENEANSEAGKIMRWFAKANPDMFTKKHMVEENDDPRPYVDRLPRAKSTRRPEFTNNVNSNMPVVKKRADSNRYIGTKVDTMKIQGRKIKALNINPNIGISIEEKHVVENNTTAIGGIRGLGNVTGEVSPTGVSQYVIDNQSNTTDGLWNFTDPSWWMNSDDRKKYHMKTVKGFKALREQLTEGINDPGRLKAVFLAGGPGSGKDFVMNKALAGNGLREINSDTAFEFLMKRNNLDLEMPDEERVEREIVRGRAKNITSRKEINSLSGRLGLIVNGTADDLEKIKTVKAELEDLGYDTMMVFVNTSNEVSRQRNVERGKSGNRKVPDGTDKQGNPDDSPNIRQEKWDLAQENLGELEKIFGKDSFTVIDNTADIRKVAPDVKEKIEADFNRVRRMTMQFVQSPVKNKRGQAWTQRRARYQGTTQYAPPKAYTRTPAPARVETPKAITKPSSGLMDQARRLGLSYYGFGRFGRKVNGVNKVMYHSKGDQLVRVQITEDLRAWFGTGKEGGVGGGGWDKYNRKGERIGKCAREPGEGKPKCLSKEKAAALRAKGGKKAIASVVIAKKSLDSEADRKGKGEKPIFSRAVAKKLQKEQVMAYLEEKNKPTNPQLWSKAKSLARQKFDVYPSAYANGWASKWYKSKGGGWKSVNEDTVSEACWDGYKQEGMKKKGGRMVPNCVPVSEGQEDVIMSKTKGGSNSPKKKIKRKLAENLDTRFETFMEEHGAGEWGTPELTSKYMSDTPGQREAMSYEFVKVAKEKKKSLTQEDNNIPRFGLPIGGGLGDEITQYRPMTVTGFTGGFGSLGSIAESIQSWVLNPQTQQKFTEKYGEIWEEKLIEAAIRLEEAGCGCNHSGKKSVKRLKEGFGLGYNDMGTVPTQRKQDGLDETSKEDIIDTSKIKSLKAYKKNIHPQSDFEKKSIEEETPAWQRSEGKDPKGGLNRKGIASYRRANPGSKLSMAVTTEPSKLKKGSKKAKRRLSFCRRMKGMKKKLTSAKTARDPNSRINKSLRKWNCEE